MSLPAASCRTPAAQVNEMRPSMHCSVIAPATTCAGVSSPASSTTRITSRSPDLNRAWVRVVTSAAPGGCTSITSPDSAWEMAMVILLPSSRTTGCHALAGTIRRTVLLGHLVADDAADRSPSGSSQNTTTRCITHNAADDGTGCRAFFLMGHPGTATQNDQGCYCKHADRILTNGFHLVSFRLKKLVKGNQHPIKCDSGLAKASRCILDAVALRITCKGVTFFFG